MTVAVLVMSDGRGDYLRRTIESADVNILGNVTARIIHEDSGDPMFARWAAETCPGWHVYATPARSGFGGAIRSAWAYVRATTTATHVFHLEGDFTFNRPVDVDELADVLDTNPHLAQLALRRQAWNRRERLAGGVIEQHPDDYTDIFDSQGRAWVEHRRFFTTNPSLYRRSLMSVGWPDGAESEGAFTHRLLEHGTPETDGPSVRFGYWGPRRSTPWVEHIGVERVGNGY